MEFIYFTSADIGLVITKISFCLLFLFIFFINSSKLRTDGSKATTFKFFIIDDE